VEIESELLEEVQGGTSGAVRTATGTKQKTEARLRPSVKEHE